MLSTAHISAEEARIAPNLARLRERVDAAATAAGRLPQQVLLLGVSKGQPAEAIAAAHRLGLVEFGENYVTEALAKIRTLYELPLRWHFIGRVQANKTRPIAENFHWVHGIDRLRIAERLSAQRGFYGEPLQVCLQVNVVGESTKGGVAPGELPDLVAAVRGLPRLRLRGLMCMLPYGVDVAAQRSGFGALRRLLEAANMTGAGLDALSMGMSDDLESAIAEGSTIVRVGTALFGPRQTPVADGDEGAAPGG